MTENSIWFVVNSDELPQEKADDKQAILYYIKEETDGKLLSFLGWSEDEIEDWGIKCYKAKTYFRMLQALEHLAKQYGPKIMFFGFTAADCDFRPRARRRSCRELEKLEMQSVIETKKEKEGDEK